MQHKTTQHKHRTLYVVKNKRNDKRLYNNSDQKYDYVPKYV